MVRTRFAPSPTGYLHLGGARTALFNWAYAKHHGGVFVLRIEDTDLERSTQQSEQAIFDAMTWLGLDWGEGPFFQMKRIDRYREIGELLLSKGLAYRAYETKEELEAMREAQVARGEKPRYDRRWRDSKEAPPAGRQAVLRFKNPLDGDVSWNDLVKGPITVSNEELDDLVLLRADGVPTYNFGVVVDDIDMAMTHVIRGDDHVNNTPRQIHIFNALKQRLPEFAHVPMILGPDGERLSKRHGAVSVMQYAEDGFLPEALVNYLARLGWSHGDAEIFDARRFVEWFDLAHISRSPAQFDPGKLRWLNHQYLKQRPDAELAKLVAPRIEREGGKLADGPPLEQAVALLKERSETLEALAEQAMMFYGEPDAKHSDGEVPQEIREPLSELAESLASIGDWAEASINEALQRVLQKHKLKMPKLAMPIRRIVFGLEQTPNLTSVLALAGKQRVVARLQRRLAR